MNEEPVYLTPEGLEKLQSTLAYLNLVKLPELIERLHDASAGGYTIDNTELIMAKSEIDQLKARIEVLTTTINTSQVIIPARTDIIGLGSKVVVHIKGEDSEEMFTIVGAVEADPAAGFISNESPFGRALLNHSAGDTVTFDTPSGKLSAKIVSVLLRHLT